MFPNRPEALSYGLILDSTESTFNFFILISFKLINGFLESLHVKLYIYKGEPLLLPGGNRFQEENRP